MRKREKMTTERMLGWGGLTAAVVSALYLSWSSLCLGPSWTQYFMTGDASNPLAATCSMYDYSRFYPWFEKKTDSLRDIRPIFETSIGRP